MNVPIWIIQGICIVLALFAIGAGREIDGPEGCIPMLVLTALGVALIFYAGHLWH